MTGSGDLACKHCSLTEYMSLINYLSIYANIIAIDVFSWYTVCLHVYPYQCTLIY